MPPCLILDRDGVIIEEEHYLGDPGRVRLIPGVATAIARVNALGWPVVVASNQAGVARGYFSEAQVGEVNGRVAELLSAGGATVRAWYHCPHHPTEGTGAYRVECACRKPAPGMLLAAARDLGLTLAHGWMVGDKLTDLQAGARAGCRTWLVRTGYGAGEEPKLDTSTMNCAGVADDLPGAIEGILRINSPSWAP
ncbi:MAG: D-glycero-alpha-D-manno-heptose-1,7-bisphosphate 7-phosphatase [Planctomycetota bacterium]